MKQVTKMSNESSPFIETFSSINKLHKQAQAVFPLQSIKETHPQIQQMTQHHDLTNAIRALTETIRTPLITQLEYLNYHLEGIERSLAWMGDPCACFREIGENLQKSLKGKIAVNCSKVFLNCKIKTTEILQNLLTFVSVFCIFVCSKTIFAKNANMFANTQLYKIY